MASKPEPTKAILKQPIRLFWAAFYDKPYPNKTAETYAQFDLDTGRENLFKHVDKARVKSMAFLPFGPEFADKINKYPGGSSQAIPMPLPQYVVHLAENQRLIVFRRNFHSYGLYPVEAHLESMGHEILYVLGWQTTETVLVNGKPQEKNMKSIMFIHENGSVELSSDYDYGSAKWQNQPQTIPEG